MPSPAATIAWVIWQSLMRNAIRGSGIDGFFREVGVPVDGREKPEPTMPDAEHFAKRMISYGIELVGPPPAP